MNNRRHFLIQGSLATTAMFVLNPFKSFADTVSSLTGIGNQSNKLVFLHTCGQNPCGDKIVINYINDIKNKNSNTILLNAAYPEQGQTYSLKYDASIQEEENEIELSSNRFKIIEKDNIRTGIISVKPDESNVIEKTKQLAAFLKKEKNCSVVVCLSQLGYKNSAAPDDIKLAENSADIDIIIGGHPQNFSLHPFIALNTNKAEVIIHAASAETFACGKIEIEFDSKGLKKQISFANHS